MPGTRDIDTIGAPDRVVHVRLDPQHLAGFGIGLSDLRSALGATNISIDAGTVVRDNQAIQIQAGTFLTSPRKSATSWSG